MLARACGFSWSADPAGAGEDPRRGRSHPLLHRAALTQSEAEGELREGLVPTRLFWGIYKERPQSPSRGGSGDILSRIELPTSILVIPLPYSSSTVNFSLWTIPIQVLLNHENLMQNYTPTGDN